MFELGNTVEIINTESLNPDWLYKNTIGLQGKIVMIDNVSSTSNTYYTVALPITKQSRYIGTECITSGDLIFAEKNLKLINEDKIEFENGSVIQPIKIKGKITRSSKADETIYLKELFMVNYKYKLLGILDEEYQTDTILIKAWDNKDVHKYMDKFRQEFINCGYDMQYSFQKVGDGNFVEV